MTEKEKFIFKLMYPDTEKEYNFKNYHKFCLERHLKESDILSLYAFKKYCLK